MLPEKKTNARKTPTQYVVTSHISEGERKQTLLGVGPASDHANKKENVSVGRESSRGSLSVNTRNQAQPREAHKGKGSAEVKRGEDRFQRPRRPETIRK